MRCAYLFQSRILLQIIHLLIYSSDCKVRCEATQQITHDANM